MDERARQPTPPTRGRGYWLPAEIAANTALTGNQKLVYAYVHSRTAAGGRRVSLAEIARDCGISRRTALRVRNDLRAAGLLCDGADA